MSSRRRFLPNRAALRKRRRGPTAGRFVALAVVLCLLGPGLAARGVDLPVPEWRAGPVRYLLTKAEDRTYKKLETRAERRRFIDQFWKRRDPSPESPYNEFRDRFWSRVRRANGLFNDTPRDGWITDRGKIYVLLGPPDDVISDEVARSHRGIILWVYRSTWSEAVGPNVVVAFARDVTGEFRISTAPSTDADVFRGLPLPNTPLHLSGNEGIREELARLGTDPLLVAQGVPSGVSELAMLADLGRLQQTDHLVLSEIVTAQALFGALPVIASSSYYKANDGTTYTALNVFLRSKSLQFRDIGGAQGPDVAVFARLENPETGALLHGFEGERDFVPAPDNATASVNDYLIFQAGKGIPPGSYVAEITVHDRVAEKTGRYTIDLEVPDFYDRKLSLSSITLAERLGPFQGSAGGEFKRPFVFGSLEVIPKPGVGYALDQEFAFYFQAYNARTDAQTGLPLLDIRYRFLSRDETGAYEPLGKPLEMIGQTQAAQGTSFPLAQWPIGSYRLEVDVTDRLSGERAQRTVEFLVR